MSRKREAREIIQVGQEILDGIDRMDRMNGDKNEMIIWVCGTVLLTLSFLFAQQEILG